MILKEHNNKSVMGNRSGWSFEALIGKYLSLCLHMEWRKQSPEGFCKQ